MTNGVLWVALAEKAYAEANGAGIVTTQHVGSDSYAALNGGYPAWALQAITGKPASYFTINPTNIAAAWNAGQLIVLGSSPNANDNLIVGDSNGTHAYAVINYNASSSTPFELYNPWGLGSVVGHTSDLEWASGLRRPVLVRLEPNVAGLRLSDHRDWGSGRDGRPRQQLSGRRRKRELGFGHFR